MNTQIGTPGLRDWEKALDLPAKLLKNTVMCQFIIPFEGNATDLTGKARTAITGAGGDFQGDDNAGQFSISTPVGKITGSYTVGGEGQALHVRIEDKPFFISCGQIEGQLKKSLGA
jgi:hypothetical protein